MALIQPNYTTPRTWPLEGVPAGLPYLGRWRWPDRPTAKTAGQSNALRGASTPAESTSVPGDITGLPTQLNFAETALVPAVEGLEVNAEGPLSQFLWTLCRTSAKPWVGFFWGQGETDIATLFTTPFEAGLQKMQAIATLLPGSQLVVGLWIQGEQDYTLNTAIQDYADRLVALVRMTVRRMRAPNLVVFCTATGGARSTTSADLFIADAIRLASRRCPRIRLGFPGMAADFMPDNLHHLPVGGVDKLSQSTASLTQRLHVSPFRCDFAPRLCSVKNRTLIIDFGPDNVPTGPLVRNPEGWALPPNDGFRYRSFRGGAGRVSIESVAWFDYSIRVTLTHPPETGDTIGIGASADTELILNAGHLPGRPYHVIADSGDATTRAYCWPGVYGIGGTTPPPTSIASGYVNFPATGQLTVPHDGRLAGFTGATWGFFFRRSGALTANALLAGLTDNTWRIGFRNDFGTQPKLTLQQNGLLAATYPTIAIPELVDGNWLVLAWTYDAGDARFYVDGDDVGNYTNPFGPVPSLNASTADLVFGGHPSWDIGRFAMWDRALSPGEVREALNRTRRSFEGTRAGTPLLDLAFDASSTATNIRDRSPSQLHGTGSNLVVSATGGP